MSASCDGLEAATMKRQNISKLAQNATQPLYLDCAALTERTHIIGQSEV
jgi:hypothetical protein